MEKNLTSYRVIYGDTDQMGVVYYANYLKWFEMGRTELLRQIGISYTSVEDKGLHFPVTEVSCRYLRPARYDDRITIETGLSTLGRASLSFTYGIFREDRELIASGWTKHACVDGKGKIIKMPSPMENALKPALSGTPKQTLQP